MRVPRVGCSDSPTIAPLTTSARGLLAAAKRAGIPDLHFHDTRHIAANLLRLQGADIHTVATVLGHKGLHKDLRMAMRYQHLSPVYLGAAMNRLDSVFNEPKKLAAKFESGSKLDEPKPAPGGRIASQ